MREAKLRTSWTDPDPGVRSRACAPTSRRCWTRCARPASSMISSASCGGSRGRASGTRSPGRCCTSPRPACPTCTRATSCGTCRLVDPDNRRPVDFERRARLLEEVERGVAGGDDARERFLRELVANPEDGRLKLHVIRSALAARRDARRVVPLPDLPAAGSCRDRRASAWWRSGEATATSGSSPSVPRRLGRLEGQPHRARAVGRHRASRCLRGGRRAGAAR